MPQLSSSPHTAHRPRPLAARAYALRGWLWALAGAALLHAGALYYGNHWSRPWKQPMRSPSLYLRTIAAPAPLAPPPPSAQVESSASVKQTQAAQKPEPQTPKSPVAQAQPRRMPAASAARKAPPAQPRNAKDFAPSTRMLEPPRAEPETDTHAETDAILSPLDAQTAPVLTPAEPAPDSLPSFTQATDKTPSLSPNAPPTAVPPVASSSAAVAAPSVTASAALKNPATASTVFQADSITATAAQAGVRVKLVIPPSAHFAYTLTITTPTTSSKGQALVLLKHSQEEYDLTLEQRTAEGKLLRRQSSNGRTGAEGFKPLRYAQSSATSSEEAAHFDYDKVYISFSNNQPNAPLPAGTQDRVSVLFQLGGLLASQGQAPATGQILLLPVASTHALEQWQLRFEGTEVLDVPLIGKTPCWKLLRLPTQTYEPRLELWYSAKQFFPLRIKSTHANGEVWDLLSTGKPTGIDN